VTISRRWLPVVAALTCALLPLAAGAQAPPAPVDDTVLCVTSCREMIARGELRESFNELACQVRVCHEQAKKYYEDDDFGRAMRSLDQIDEAAGYSPAYQLDRGLVNYALGNFDAALANFDTVLEVRPGSLRASAQRAHTLMRLDRIPESRAQFDKILSDPRAELRFKQLNTRSYVKGNLGVLRLIEEDLAGGVADMAEALEIDASNKLARAFTAEVIPALESGALQYSSVLPLVVSWEELALGRPNRSLKLLSKVLSESPDFRLGYILVAETQRRYMDFPGCETTLRMAEKRFVDDTEVYASRIRCTMLRYGIHAPESVPSIKELKELAAKDPNDPLVHEIMILITD
jgi:tetratricopeptide (TPR) repeat protein